MSKKWEYVRTTKKPPLELWTAAVAHPVHGVKTIMTKNKCRHTAYPAEVPRVDLRNNHSPEILRVLAIGSPEAVNSFVTALFHCGYARPDEWSAPLPTGNLGEVMRILTKRIGMTE